MPARKKVRKTKKSKRKRAAKRVSRRGTARKTLTAVEIGDVVRFPAEARNLIGRYDPAVARGARAADAIEGIVCSIRSIATGKLIPKTRGDLSGHVLEIMHDQTFQLHYASDRNTGGARGPENVRENPVWQRVREVLREMASGKQLISAASGGLGQEPLHSLLDGWRVVKVKAEYVESAE